MLRRVNARDMLRAMEPLFKNTPHSPATDRTPRVLNTGADLRAYLEDFGSRVLWQKCERCAREWNNIPDGGVCIGCIDEDQAKERQQRELGVYLKKAIGSWGLSHYRFDNFIDHDKNEKAFQAAMRFDPAKESLFMWGNAGVGKTHLAGAIIKKMAADNHSVQWINPMYVTRWLRGRFPDDEQAFVDRIVSKEVVFFDDLGKSRDLDGVVRLIYEVLDRRKAMGQSGIVITCNLSLDALAVAYKDDRISSRIAGLCKVIEVAGEDHRVPSS